MTKQKVLGRKYTGTLAEPIYEPIKPKIGMLSDQFGRGKDPAQEAKKRAVRRQCEKFAELFKHYKLRPGDWATLACALAIEHVPGFEVYLRTAPQSGASTKWTPAQNDELIDAVNDILAGHEGLTIEEAVAHLRSDSTKWGEYS